MRSLLAALVALLALPMAAAGLTLGPNDAIVSFITSPDPKAGEEIKLRVDTKLERFSLRVTCDNGFEWQGPIDDRFPQWGYFTFVVPEAGHCVAQPQRASKSGKLTDVRTALAFDVDP